MLVLLALIGTVSLANASTPTQDFCARHSASTNCPETPWILAARKTLCESSPEAVSTPEVILFYFDGADYFSPREAKDSLHAVNLSGNEMAEPLRNGVNAWIHFWLPAFATKSKINWDTKVEFHYHSGDGFEPFHGEKDGLQCFSSVSQDLLDLQSILPNFVKPKIALVGHSNGGASAIGIASAANYAVDLVLLIDPVPLAPSFIEEKISDQEFEFWENGIPGNVSRVADIYQQTDMGSLAGIIAIRGSEIPGAANLRNLVMMPDPITDHRKDHVRMLIYPDTVDFVSDELVKLIGK